MAQPNLTEAHVQAWDAINQKLGISAGAMSEATTLDTGATPGPTILSYDAAESHVPPTHVEVRDIAHLKDLAGVEDAHYAAGTYSDAAIHYPDPLPQATMSLMATSPEKCDVDQGVGPDELGTVRQAAQAFVQGHSEKVKDYEPVINSLYFPSTMAVFAGESITVSPGNPLIIKGPGPVTLNYQSITVQPGGQIIIQTDATVNSQIFTSNT
jgi:hypothetical protein